MGPHVTQRGAAVGCREAWVKVEAECQQKITLCIPTILRLMGSPTAACSGLPPHPGPRVLFTLVYSQAPAPSPVLLGRALGHAKAHPPIAVDQRPEHDTGPQHTTRTKGFRARAPDVDPRSHWAAHAPEGQKPFIRCEHNELGWGDVPERNGNGTTQGETMQAQTAVRVLYACCGKRQL